MYTVWTVKATFNERPNFSELTQSFGREVRSAAWLSDDEFGVSFLDRSAAKDAAWVLLMRRDVDHVSVNVG